MDPSHILNQIQSLYGGESPHTILGHYAIVLRAGTLARAIREEQEAGDMLIIPPSVVTSDTPTRGYVQGCIEKCWPQIKDLKL